MQLTLPSTVGQAIQATGDLVVFGTTAGQTPALIRLNSNGTRDPSFGQNGLASLTNPGSATLLPNTGGVAIGLNQTIVVATDFSVNTVTGTSNEIEIERMLADGSPDTTFGNQGVVSFQFSQGTSLLQSTVSAVAIQPDGKIVIGGLAGTAPTNEIAPENAFLARFNADGTIDSTFGTSGQVAISNPAGSVLMSDGFSENGLHDLAIAGDGSIVYDITVSDSGNLDALGKLDARGSAVTTFGTAGQAIVPLAYTSENQYAMGLAIQTDGKIIVGRTDNAVLRLDADGTLDTTFGTMGVATTPGSASSSLLLQPDGKIVIAGSMGNVFVGPSYPIVTRLTTNGSPDLSFGVGGTSSLPNLSGVPTALTIQADGKLLMATQSTEVRLLGNGATNDFDNDGISDPAILMPNFTVPIFAYRPSSGGPDVLEGFGTPGPGQTLPAPGAYDGSGIDELAVYLPAIGAFGIRPYGTTGAQDQIVYIGTPGLGNSIPAPADYTGSGHTQAGVYEPATGTFVYSPTNSSDPATFVTVPFGIAGAGQSIPAPADYDGSGHDELGVYLTASGSFAYRPANSWPDVVIPFGMPGAGNSIPVPGDYDGSGHTELAVYMPTLGAFAYRPYGTNGSDDQIIYFGMPGIGNSIPVSGDYDGSGHTELAVYIPSIRMLAYRPYGTTGSDDQYIFFGEPGQGNSVPFNAAGAASIQESNSGGGSPSPSVAKATGGLDGYVDFVPDLAGQPKKSGNSGSSSTSIQGSS